MTKKQFKKSIHAINSIIQSYGGHSSLCKALSCQYQQLWKWKMGVVKVPLKQAYKLSRITDYTIEDIRPDLDEII